MGYIFQDTAIGILRIEKQDGYLTSIKLVNKKEPNNITNRILIKAKDQLNEYFSGKRKVFNLPLKIVGTDFQKSVWKALLNIKYGETKSYKDIAEEIGNPKACRAIGMANNKNDIIIVIPCHRVIGNNKKLVGYACGLDIKEKLLKLESDNSSNNKK